MCTIVTIGWQVGAVKLGGEQVGGPVSSHHSPDIWWEACRAGQAERGLEVSFECLGGGNGME